MTPSIPTIAEKCKGALLATAVGDALGWPNERPSKTQGLTGTVSTHFIEWVRKGNAPTYQSETILPGEYSDDTQLTLSVARSIIAGNWEVFFMKQELPFWLNYQRGGGRAVLTAARFYKIKSNYKLWESGKKRDYFNAGGNGAAMRILPHVIANAASNNIAPLMIDVFRNTMITHGHPRAFLGALCYAFALNHLLRKKTDLKRGELIQAVLDGKCHWGELTNFHIFDDWIITAPPYGEHDFRTEWEVTCTRMTNQLAMLLKELPKGTFMNDRDILARLDCFGKASGAGDVTILAALYLSTKYASNPVLGMKVPAFSHGADTDTIASITGGLLGMLNGMDWLLPEWLEVQDYTCLLHIADLLLAENGKELVKAETIALEKEEDEWQSSPIGKMKPILVEDTSTDKTISKWRTALGQTLYRRDQPHKNRSAQPTTDMSQHTAWIEKDNPSTEFAPTETPPIFSLSKEGITALREDPVFNKKITCGKILDAVALLLENTLTPEKIAKKLRLHPSMVEQLKRCIR